MKNLLSRLISIVLIIVFFVLFIDSFLSNSVLILYPFLIFINLILIYKVRNNTFYLLFYFFCLFYTLALIPYYFFGVNVSAWKDFNEIKYYNIATQIYGVFLITPFLFNIKNYVNFEQLLKFKKDKNSFAFGVFSVICLLIIVFGQSGSTIFESGGYGTGDSSKSTIYEYFIIFFLLAYYYSGGHNRFKNIILGFLATVYVFKSLLFGGRIEVVQFFLLILYISVLDYKVKISSFKIVVGVFILYYVNQVFSGIRSDPIYLLEGKYSYYLNPFSQYSNSNAQYISSNEGDVFQSSVRLIGLIENGLLDFSQRIFGFLGFILSIAVPSSWLPAQASLITYKKEIYNSGGGGLAPVYFFAYLSWIGPILISSYVFFVFKLALKKKDNIYIKFYCIMVFSTFPRWFAYNPIILFKLCLWIVPLLFFSKLIFRRAFFLNKKV